MERGVTFRSYVPMRRDPSETSEMVSQVLFGEEFRILESESHWLHISLDFDNCQGWVDKKSVFEPGAENKVEKREEPLYRVVSHPFMPVLDLTMGQQLILPAGSIWRGTTGNGMILHDRVFEAHSEEGLITPGPDVDPEVIGKGLLSLPHLWGGRSGFGFDSAGLVQMLCMMMGASMPRHCQMQAGMGATINLMQEVKRGDLAFFDNMEGVIEHVGMALGEGWILHCYQQVRIDRLDQQGIFNVEKKDYTHKLRLVKRVVT